jgi:hypothetical protein
VNTGELVLLILVLLMASAAFMVWLARPQHGPTKKEKQLELLVDEIRELAFEYRDTDAALSYKITDKITKHNRKELT